jgi:putative transcriptional regulator
MPGKNKELGVNLKEYRLQRGLTQEDLAARVGVRRETIVFLEQGKYNPSLKLALMIAAELSVSIDKLFYLKD